MNKHIELHINNEVITDYDILSAKITSLFDTKPPVILCIGSKKVVGDSVAPIIGQNLVGSTAYVYGTLDKPVNALNLEKTIERIKINHSQNKIIAIDSCLGNKEEHTGIIKIYEGGLIPGLAYKKKLPKIGDISIKVIVAQMSETLGESLYYVEPKFVYELAEKVSVLIKNILITQREFK